MRVISKSISLEPFISRFPGVLPAYLEGELYYFALDDIRSREDMYPSNYGMFPVNLRFSGITDAEGNLSFEGKEYDDYGITSGVNNTITMSYVRLKEWFYFFKNYYHLLTQSSNCSRVYSSATDYYDAEMESALYDKSSNITHDRSYYEELDTLFKYRGGVLDIEINDCDGKPAIVNITDKGFYKWLSVNCFPLFVLPKDEVEVYNADTLTYPDVIRWAGWLKERLPLYSGKTVEDCVETCDCCDCEEFFRRGGADMLAIFTAWLNDVNNVIVANNAIIAAGLDYDDDDAETALTTERKSCYYPHIVYHFGHQQSVDDMGIMSIFSEEWEPGVNYAKSDEASGATVVVKDGDTFILSATSKPGYKFDYEFLEMVWGNDPALPSETSSTRDVSEEWGDYTKKYVNEHPENFSFSGHQYYTFNEQGSVVHLTTGSTAHSFKIGDFYYPYAKAIYYPINDETGLGCFLINNVVYPINEKQYIVYNSEKYFVEFFPVTNTPYVIVNGVKHYGEWVINATGGTETPQEYKFPTLGGITSQSGLFVLYEDLYYSFTGTILTIDTKKYQKLDGYIVDDGLKYYVRGNNVVSSDYMSGGTNQVFRVVNKPFVAMRRFGAYMGGVKPFVPYDASYVSGYTESKLTSLKSTDVYYDDLGNELGGWYNMSSGETYAQPAEGEELEPYYSVGNVGELSFLKSEAGQNYYCGDIISAMVFYSVTLDGKPDENTVYGLTLEDNSGSTLQGIRYAFTHRQLGVVYEPNVYCNITYCVGATLHAISGGYEIEDEGVVYDETVQFKQNVERFFVTEKNSNLVYTYDIIEPEKKLKLATYDVTTNVPMALFKAKTYNLLNENSGLTKHNNTMAAPVFRREELLGMSVGENVQENIYIERGINAAFEQHLKLGEIYTLEALENYGNGAFRIMTN